MKWREIDYRICSFCYIKSILYCTFKNKTDCIIYYKIPLPLTVNCVVKIKRREQICKILGNLLDKA